MSKSRGERGGKTPSTNQNATVAAPNAIVPGKFMGSEWVQLVDKENGDEFVHNVLDEILTFACDQIFQNIVADRVQPYAVLKAKNLLCQMLELRFIENDCGENENSLVSTWVEDAEPLACVTDSWAQGAVPVLPDQSKLTVPNNEFSQVDTLVQAEEDIQELVSNDIVSCTREENSNNSRIEQLVVDKIEVVANSQCTNDEIAIYPRPPPKIKGKKHKEVRRKKSKRYGGSVPKFQPITMTPVTEDYHVNKHLSNSYKPSLDSIPNGVSNISKDAIFDENGNLVHVGKIDFSKLPQHRVKTKYIVEDSLNDNTKKIQLLTRKNKHLKQRRVTHQKEQLLKKNLVSTEPLLQRLYHSTRDTMLTSDACSRDALYTPLPPSIVDTIEVSRGVSVREAGLTRQGPKPNSVTPEDSISASKISSNNFFLSMDGGKSCVLNVKEIVSNASVNSFKSNTIITPIIKT